MYESCHIWISDVKYKWAMLYMNESCPTHTHTYTPDSKAVEWRWHPRFTIPHIWISHVTHEWAMLCMNESCHTHQTQRTYMNKSCHIWMSHVMYEWVLSHTPDSKAVEVAPESHWPSIHALILVVSFMYLCLDMRVYVFLCVFWEALAPLCTLSLWWLSCVAVCCSVLQRVLQCAVVYCSVLQCGPLCMLLLWCLVSWLYLWTCVCRCLRTYVCMYVRMFVRNDVCIYVCMYLRMCVCTLSLW